MAKKNPDWWRGAVIYQIYPRSFKDSNGDGVGDLRGIIQQMPYLQSLNVDALWISPFFKSPMLTGAASAASRRSRVAVTLALGCPWGILGGRASDG